MQDFWLMMACTLVSVIQIQLMYENCLETMRLLDLLRKK